MSAAILVLVLVVLCAILMVLESRGLKTTLALTFKGDIKRESRWLAQYGQFVCTAVAVALIWQLDGAHRGVIVPVIVAVSVATAIATGIKRLVSRVRPGRENAGKFLGPSWSHANYRESFPSSHSASAVALSLNAKKGKRKKGDKYIIDSCANAVNAAAARSCGLSEWHSGMSPFLRPVPFSSVPSHPSLEHQKYYHRDR